MTQEYTDDVTGKLITGNTERWFRIGGLSGQVFGPQDVVDLDTLLDIIRDHVTSKSSPPPLDIYTLMRVPGVKPPALAKYAPPEPEPEAAAAATPADDGPFGQIRRFYVGGPTAAGKAATFAGLGASLPPLYRIADRPKKTTDELLARVDKRRTQYAAALAAACGCNDVIAHEGSVYKP